MDYYTKNFAATDIPFVTASRVAYLFCIHIHLLKLYISSQSVGELGMDVYNIEINTIAHHASSVATCYWASCLICMSLVSQDYVCRTLCVPHNRVGTESMSLPSL